MIATDLSRHENGHVIRARSPSQKQLILTAAPGARGVRVKNGCAGNGPSGGGIANDKVIAGKEKHGRIKPQLTKNR